MFGVILEWQFLILFVLPRGFENAFEVGVAGKVPWVRENRTR